MLEVHGKLRSRKSSTSLPMLRWASAACVAEGKTNWSRLAWEPRSSTERAPRGGALQLAHLGGLGARERLRSWCGAFRLVQALSVVSRRSPSAIAAPQDHLFNPMIAVRSARSIASLRVFSTILPSNHLTWDPNEWQNTKPNPEIPFACFILIQSQTTQKKQ